MNEDIKELIEEYQLQTRSRKRETVYKRYYLMHALFIRSNMTLTDIGKLFNRDHSSVIHAIKEHKRWFKNMDREYLRAIHPLPELVNDISEIPVSEYLDCEAGEDYLVIRGKFTKQFLNEFNKKLTKDEISDIFAST